MGKASTKRYLSHDELNFAEMLIKQLAHTGIMITPLIGWIDHSYDMWKIDKKYREGIIWNEYANLIKNLG